MKTALKIVILTAFVSFLGWILTKPVPPSEKYADVVDKVMPAVVEIRVTGILHIVKDYGPFGKEEMDVPASVMGSGVFINSKGYILTVAHLFRDFKKIQSIIVMTPDGGSVFGDVKKIGKNVDLALVQVYFYKVTPYVKLADPRLLRVGQEVIAIGSPAGLSFSVSNGIISALYRDFEFAYNVTQSNTAINPGNSGGPLFNMRGELVGINSFFIMANPQLAVFSGLGFSVQIGECLKFLTDAAKDIKDLKPKSWFEKLMGVI